MTTESSSKGGSQGQSDQGSHATLGQKPMAGSASQDKSKEPQMNKERSAGQSASGNDEDMDSPGQSPSKDQGEANRGRDKQGSSTQPGQSRGSESHSR